MVTRLCLDLWRIGHHTHVTFAEYDEDRKLIFRTTYPITYAESCDFGHWATNRVKKQGCEFHLGGDGWSVWFPINEVIQDDIPFHPLHSSSRRDPKNSAIYADLVQAHYSLVYAAD
jgi:hypothetical protein